ncbi:MAG: 56kDa selenium binding protein [Alphaproteobacteria bacterium]|jgi:hypothetical protein|nr:56kDa selenium binding protein [Alphaproteobacteria bacterium]
MLQYATPPNTATVLSRNAAASRLSSFASIYAGAKGIRTCDPRTAGISAHLTVVLLPTTDVPLSGSVRTGRVMRRTPHPGGGDYRGGPQMVEISRDRLVTL